MVATTSIVPTTALSTVPPTIVSTIERQTVEELLARYAAAAREFDLGAIQRIHPRLTERERLRLDALTRAYSYCEYKFGNVQIVSSSGTDATVRAESGELCKPRTRQGPRANTPTLLYQFHLLKTPTGWIIDEILASQ